jgi:hypothetical protein
MSGQHSIAKDRHLTIEVMTRRDAPAAARLHRTNFPDDPFTLAGEGVLLQLFEEFVDEACLTAKLDGELVGYSVGTLDKSHFMRRLARRHWPVLGAGIALAAVRHANQAPGYVRGFIRWLATPRSPAATTTAVSMYEAISKDARRLGIPPLFFLELHARWIVHAEKLGAGRIEGQVTDHRMLAALSRLGYRLERTVTTRNGSKHYISCRVPSEAAYRWALQGAYGDLLKEPVAVSGQMPSPAPKVPDA